MKINKFRKQTMILTAFLFLAGCGGPVYFIRPNVGPVGEIHRPTLEAVWAQPEFGDGALWKIYVRASDPDGDLDKVFIAFDQLGGTYPGEHLIIPPSQRKRMNGAVLVWAYVKGFSADPSIHGTTYIHVEDRAGNISDSKTFEFTVLAVGPGDKGEAPPSFEKNVSLGQVDFPIQSNEDLGSEECNTPDC